MGCPQSRERLKKKGNGRSKETTKNKTKKALRHIFLFIFCFAAPYAGAGICNAMHATKTFRRERSKTQISHSKHACVSRARVCWALKKKGRAREHVRHLQCVGSWSPASAGLSRHLRRRQRETEEKHPGHNFSHAPQHGRIAEPPAPVEQQTTHTLVYATTQKKKKKRVGKGSSKLLHAATVLVLTDAGRRRRALGRTNWTTGPGPRPFDEQSRKAPGDSRPSTALRLAAPPPPHT